jgi:hypothetical protein
MAIGSVFPTSAHRMNYFRHYLLWRNDRTSFFAYHVLRPLPRGLKLNFSTPDTGSIQLCSSRFDVLSRM